MSLFSSVVVVGVVVVVEVVVVEVVVLDVVEMVEEGEVGALEAFSGLKRGISVEVRSEQTKEFCE